MAAKDTIGVGFIGAGDIATLHAKAVKKCPGARLVGLWNRSQDRARQRASEFDCRNYPTPTELVNDPTIDAVFVLTNLESAISLNGLPPGTPSNKLPLKIIPRLAAGLESITPAEGIPGAPFVIKGSGFEIDPSRNRVIFKQGDRFLMVDQRTVKSDAVSVSSFVPDLQAGDYEVIVLTQPEAPSLNGLPPGVPSNAMKFTVLPIPVPVLETISPTDIIQGGAFTLTGKNLNKNFAVVFKQGDKQFIVPSLLLKMENGMLSGTIPTDLLPGAAEVFQAQSSTGPFSNKLPLTVKAKP